MNNPTDTNQASELYELYELCKEVYKRTGGWGTEENALTNHKLWHPEYPIPLYTSDYLLEKLPPSIESKEYPGKRAFLWTRKEDDSLDKYPEGRVSYFAWYFVVGKVDGVSDYGASADTPLKALLKLTIALSGAGELNNE